MSHVMEEYLHLGCCVKGADGAQVELKVEVVVSVDHKFRCILIPGIMLFAVFSKSSVPIPLLLTLVFPNTSQFLPL
jgi:hypothetical protein